MALRPNEEERFEQIGLYDTKGGKLPTITTATGYFDFTANTVSLDDMAYALSGIRRYGGHARPRINVAQHSLTVAALAKDPFEGLMHDGHEYTVGDMAKPIRVLLPDYNAVENVASSLVRTCFGLPEKLSPETVRADICTLFWEAYWVIHNKGLDWNGREMFFMPWMEKVKLTPLSDEHTEWLFKLAVASMWGKSIEHQRTFVNNTLRRELGIPLDVDIYAEA